MIGGYTRAGGGDCVDGPPRSGLFVCFGVFGTCTRVQYNLIVELEWKTFFKLKIVERIECVMVDISRLSQQYRDPQLMLLARRSKQEATIQ